GESLSPRRRIIMADFCAGVLGKDFTTSRDQDVTQNPGGLHRHANPFGDDGVSFTGGISNCKNPSARAKSNSRLDRPGRKPDAIQPRIRESLVYSPTFCPNVCQHSLGSPNPGQALANALQLLLFDATGKTDAIVIG